MNSTLSKAWKVQTDNYIAKRRKKQQIKIVLMTWDEYFILMLSTSQNKHFFEIAHYQFFVDYICISNTFLVLFEENWFDYRLSPFLFFHSIYQYLIIISSFHLHFNNISTCSQFPITFILFLWNGYIFICSIYIRILILV